MAGPLLKFATEGEYRERENGATRKRGRGEGGKRGAEGGDKEREERIGE